MRKRLFAVFGISFAIAILILSLLLVIAQTPPINAKRIDILEQNQAKQEAGMIDSIKEHADLALTMEKEHSQVMTEFTELKTSFENQTKIFYGCMAAIFIALVGNFFQHRETQKTVNGRTTSLDEELKESIAESGRLKLELSNCVNQARCPLSRHVMGKEPPPELTETPEHNRLVTILKEVLERYNGEAV